MKNDIRVIDIENHDRLADAIKRHPDRFGGYISLAPEDPEWSTKFYNRTHKLVK